MKTWQPEECYKCKKPFNETDFYAVRTKGRVKYDIYCKECRSVYNAEYRKQNPIKRYLYKQEPCKRFRQDRERRNFSDFSDYFRLNPHHFCELYQMEFNQETAVKAFNQLTMLMGER